MFAYASVLALVAVAALPRAARAASAPTADEAAGAASVTEVVVTAQKRAQSLISVPISLTALSGSVVQAEHITTFDDLSRTAPGVAFDSNATFGTTNLSIRGVSSSAGSATVGLYIDDVSITTKNFFYEGAVEPVITDLDRIEVLRGPQGTLYGDSSEGGTVRWITKAPSLTTYSAEAAVGTSNTERGGENYSASFAVNLPIVKDVFAIRASGSAETDSGWINHYTQTFGPDMAVLGGGVVDKKGVNSERIYTYRIVGKVRLISSHGFVKSFQPLQNSALQQRALRLQLARPRRLRQRSRC